MQQEKNYINDGQFFAEAYLNHGDTEAQRNTVTVRNKTFSLSVGYHKEIPCSTVPPCPRGSNTPGDLL